MLKLTTILFPTDFSKPSEYALETAVALARDHGARLVILHVILPRLVYGQPRIVYDDLLPPPPGSEAEYEARIRQALHHLEEADPAVRDVRIETCYGVGDAASGILVVARRLNADLIVMGTHARSGFDRLIMGSVAEQTLRNAPCPVVVIKGATAEVPQLTEPVAAGR